MLVGINYPWINYGYDFGDPPPSWVNPGQVQAWRARKRERIASDLRYFKCLGFFAVRWFLLADGTNYGMERQAPQLDRPTNRWMFSPLPPGHQFYAQLQHDFAFVLRTCVAYGLKIVPVLVSRSWVFPGQRPNNAPEVIKGGRAAIFNDALKRRIFFDNVLDPLLAISRRYPNTIYAWDLVNEPDLAAPNHVPLGRMLDFIREGAQRINNSAFRSTVGFARSRTMINWQSQNLGTTLSQFHYYPEGDSLPSRAQISRQPLFLGEFASAVHRPWPELQQQGRSQTISNRLRLIEAKGYPAAFIWSARPGANSDPDKPATNWTAGAEDEVLRYTRPLPIPDRFPTMLHQGRRLCLGGNREGHDGY